MAIEARGQAFADALRRAWDHGDAVLPVDPRLPPGAAEDLVRSMRVGEPVDHDAALVVPTSGTTGRPKGVVLTHGNVAASAEATSGFLGVDPARHRWLACLPLSHVGGLSVVTRALHTGTALDVHDRFEAGATDRAAAAGATHVSLVATALARIDPRPWTTIVLGGSAPPAVLPANCVVTYGMTETGSGVVYDGHPLDGVDVDVATDGEIRVRGPMVARRYRDGRPVTDADGWLATGDLGRWHDGTLVVDGRRDDLIVTGGENVWPEPVERRLRSHPGVADVAVTGRPDPEWGQAVVAVAVAAPGTARPDLAQLRGWVKETMPAHAAPRVLEWVDALPRTALGKLRRSTLAQRAGSTSAPPSTTSV